TTCTYLDAVDADIAILGAPSDEGSPWKPGARFAPRKIRELSIKYAGYGPVQHQLGYYDIDENRRFVEYERRQHRIVDGGDSGIVYTNVRRTFDNITRDVRRLLDAGAFPVVIGGDHAITYPVVRAYTERLNVVHFDAHMDYRPFIHGVQWANGNPIRNVEHSRHERRPAWPSPGRRAPRGHLDRDRAERQGAWPLSRRARAPTPPRVSSAWTEARTDSACSGVSTRAAQSRNLAVSSASVRGLRGWPLAWRTRRESRRPSRSRIVTSLNRVGRQSRVVCSGWMTMRTLGIRACTSARRTRSSVNCASPTDRPSRATATQ